MSVAFRVTVVVAWLAMAGTGIENEPGLETAAAVFVVPPLNSQVAEANPLPASVIDPVNVAVLALFKLTVDPFGFPVTVMTGNVPSTMIVKEAAVPNRPGTWSRCRTVSL